MMKTSLVPLNHSFSYPENSKTLEIHPQLHKENENSFSHISTELGHVLELHKAWQALKPLLSAARE